MIAGLIFVLTLLGGIVIAHVVVALREERAENRRLRRENLRLVTLVGERYGVAPAVRPPLAPPPPPLFKAREVE